MKNLGSLRLLLIAIPTAVVTAILFIFIAGAVADSQGQRIVPVAAPTQDETYEIITTTSPTPAPQESVSANPEAETNEANNYGNSANQSGSLPDTPFGWTEAQIACDAQMRQISDGSNRVANAYTVAYDNYNRVSQELFAKYPGIPSGEWSPEDSSRLQSALSEMDRANNEVTAFWAPYSSWASWGCGPDGMWHTLR